jgi:hypothetical protein
MDAFRYLLALLLCLLGFYLIFDLFAHGFSSTVLLAMLGAFVAAHLVKPRRTDDQDANALVEFLDLFVDWPFRLLSAGLRSLGRNAGSSDLGDFD